MREEERRHHGVELAAGRARGCSCTTLHGTAWPGAAGGPCKYYTTWYYILYYCCCLPAGVRGRAGQSGYRGTLPPAHHPSIHPFIRRQRTAARARMGRPQSACSALPPGRPVGTLITRTIKNCVSDRRIIICLGWERVHPPETISGQDSRSCRAPGWRPPSSGHGFVRRNFRAAADGSLSPPSSSRNLLPLQF